MKVLMICKALPCSYAGGIQTHAWSLSKEMIKRGHDLSIITAKNIFRKKKKYTEDGIKVIPVSYISGKLPFFHLFLIDELSFNLFVFFELFKTLILQKESYDIIHIHGRSGFLVMLLKNYFNLPVVVTFHGTVKSENEAALKEKTILLHHFLEIKSVQLYASAIERFLIKKADGIIAVSKRMVEILKEEYNVDGSNISIVHNGINISEFKPATMNRIPNRIVSVARLDPRKGFSFLIDAVKLLLPYFPRLSVHIVGDGSQRSLIQEQINNLRLQNVVKLVGRKEGADLLKEYHEAEIFVLPSLGESQGIAYMEAMACGLPVVAFNIGGVNEMISYGKEGFLVEKGNTKSLVKAIMKLLSNNSLASKFGSCGKKRVEMSLQWAKIAGQTEHIYNSII